jgi:deoxycytidylate deaminase
MNNTPEENLMKSPHGYDYPFLPQNIELRFTNANHPMMLRAKEWARLHSLDKHAPNASVIVKDGVEIAIGANGSNFHQQPKNIAVYGPKGCRRVYIGAKTGEQYEECDGCHPKNHGEPRALADAAARGIDVHGAEVYMWGHWWCCKWCCEKMEAAGITAVYVLDNADILFNSKDPNNILGKQFV